MKAERAWTGAVCGFFLFVVVCLSLLLHMKGTFRAGGNPELGLLLFLLPGALASFLSGTTRDTAAGWRNSGGAGLPGGDADFLCYSADVLAGAGVAV